jgi:hypothetical protein
LLIDDRDFRFIVPFGVLSISIASPITGPWRVEVPGGAGRALVADFSLATSLPFEILTAEIDFKMLVDILKIRKRELSNRQIKRKIDFRSSLGREDTSFRRIQSLTLGEFANKSLVTGLPCPLVFAKGRSSSELSPDIFV